MSSSTATTAEFEDDSQNSYHMANSLFRMPPFKYARIPTTPRSASDQDDPVSCSTMGRATLRPPTAAATTMRLVDDSYMEHRPLVAFGFSSGAVRLMDALSGSFLTKIGSSDGSHVRITATNKNNYDINSGIHNSETLAISSSQKRVLALCFDSTSTHLAGMDTDGNAAIFGPFQWRRRQPQKQPLSPNESSCIDAPYVSETTPLALAESPIQALQFSYMCGEGPVISRLWSNTQSPALAVDMADGVLPTSPAKFLTIKTPENTAIHTIRPTCMALNPAYTRSKEHASLIVGFNNGKLVLSKLLLGSRAGGVVGAVVGSSMTKGLRFFGAAASAVAAVATGEGGGLVKKVDSVLYQGVENNSYNSLGIESIAWRGGMVAWADSSGVRILDIDSMTRIAHIDRPNGARASLYPTISSLHPSILFERSDSLLIAWGDCLMGMSIKEVTTTQKSSIIETGGTITAATAASTRESKRKIVNCTMAWELDCVACGVVPVDGKHVAVLGLLPSPSHSDIQHDDDDNNNSKDVEKKAAADADKNTENDHEGGCLRSTSATIAGGDNIIELQIINRLDGKSISNDQIPLLEMLKTATSSDSSFRSELTKANTVDFALLSSYSTQRMEDLAEWETLEDGEKEIIRNEVDMSEFMEHQTFPDPHLRWNMEKDICTIEIMPVKDDEQSVGKISMITESQLEAEDVDNDDQSSDASNASNRSILSDDYVFPLSEPIQDLLPDQSVSFLRSQPPLMLIQSKHDACLVQTRDTDDVISYARYLRKPALALRHALVHRRDVRRHGIDLLIDDFFVALLRMQDTISRRKNISGKIDCESKTPLSLSRLQIAAQSLSILLGGDARMWQRWIFVFAEIPGGLFLIREKIPVRDPWLPPYVFEMALEKMLEETSFTLSKHEQNEVGDKITDLFMETLRSWGPTSAIRRRIQLHRYCIQSQHWGLPTWRTKSDDDEMTAPFFIQQAEKDLQRRITQTAFGVVTDVQSISASRPISLRQHIASSDDALFDIKRLISIFSKRLFSAQNDGDYFIDKHHGDISHVVIGKVTTSAPLIIESIAELEQMRERYDRALGYYLAIGSWFMENSISTLEESAVRAVNNYNRNDSASCVATFTKESQKAMSSHKYEHVLSLIELHQLHHLLLRRTYFIVDEKDDSVAESPIVSLIKLVGLERARTFLMESCSPAEDAKFSVAENEAFDRNEGVGGSLPLDLVSNQLRSRPKLLYWYLFQIFIHKPEIYVVFPTTAVPPLVITDLHQTQFSLFLDYADSNSSNEDTTALSTVFVVDEETPFMSFLKAALPHGGISIEAVRDMLNARRGDRIDSPVFARELAFVIEKFSPGNVDDAKNVLQLYLLGANNLYLGVAYAERNAKYSSVLWEMLVNHCTKGEEQGALFGTILEAAAHCGADLSSLVAKIPEGLAIEGLRPKLIAAVTDYRYKVKIHEFESNILIDDKVSILRELSHVSRRGHRVLSPSRVKEKSGQVSAQNSENASSEPISWKHLLHIKKSKIYDPLSNANSFNTFSLALR